MIQNQSILIIFLQEKLRKNSISDQVTIEFPDYETAEAYRREMESYWNDYLCES
jgi:hypothetical protein